MKALIQQMIADSMEMEYGVDLIERECTLSEIPNTATVLIGMRRTGKTCRMFQRIRELVAAGVERRRILYLNLLLLTSFTEDEIKDSGRSIRMMPAWKWFLKPQREVDAS